MARGWIRKTAAGKYRANWRDPEGRTRSKTFDRAGDAKAHLAEVETNKRHGTYQDPRIARKTLRDFWEEFLENAPGLRPATLDLYGRMTRRYILPRLGSRQLGSLTPLDVKEWVARLSEGAGPATVHAAFRVLRRILSSAVEAEIIARNPARGIKTPRAEREEMRFLGAEELGRVAAAVPQRYRALVLLLGYRGLRIGEATALRVEDLDLLRGKVNVTKAFSEVRGRLILGPTKTGANRSVSLPKFLREEVAAHLAAFPAASDGLVFTGPEGGPLHRSNFRLRVWGPALRAAEIADPRPRVHDLRHTAAALAIAAGGHPKEIQALLGHSSITVTLDRYGHLFPSLDERMNERLEEVFLSSAEGRPT